MQIVEYIVAFLVTLGVLVTVHELGHYVVARWSGVRVLRFSIGFGRPIWQKKDSHGTEWTLSLLPLGGYVRMLDDRDPDAADKARPGDLAFGQLHPSWRIAISLGGPFANFLLAIVAYWVLAVAGSTTMMPVLGVAPADSPVAKAGLEADREIVSVDGQRTRSWSDVAQTLAVRLGETGDIRLETREPGSSSSRKTDLPITDWHRGVAEPDLLGSLGIVPARPAVFGFLEPGAPAERSGLRVGDRIVAINGQQVSDWTTLQQSIAGAADGTLAVEIRRDGFETMLEVIPERRDTPEGARPVIGIGPLLNEVSYGPLAAIPEAVTKTGDAISMTLSLLKKMIFGQISVSNLSGPITIAQVAGDSARVGWHYFVGILALLSVSLGVLNLLPIPVLDGGHVIYAGAEWASGKPVPEKVQIVGFQFGMFVVGGLMVLALFNDFARIFGG